MATEPAVGTGWYADNRFWQLAAMLDFEDRRAKAAGDVDNILKLLSPKPGCSVLDLCCGHGRHAIEFARRGFEVTAVDRNSSFLEKAKKRAESAGTAAEWIEADMRSYRDKSRFDLAVCLWTSFGYFESESDDHTVLCNLLGSLKPGGCLLLEAFSKELEARYFARRSWQEQNGVLLLDSKTVQPGWSWITRRWTFVTDNGREDFTIGYRPYSGKELSEVLIRTGFATIDLYGGLDGRPFDSAATHLFAVANKPLNPDEQYSLPSVVS